MLKSRNDVHELLPSVRNKIYEVAISNLSGQAGKILKADNELIIACGQGAVSLKKVQKAGGKPMNIQDFLRGNKFTVNEDFN